ILKGEDLARNLPEDSAYAILLVEEICPKAGDVWNLVAEIDVTGFFEEFDLIFWSDLVEHGLEGIVLQRRKIDAVQFAPDAQDWRVARRQVQIGGILLEHQIEEGVNLCHTRPCRVAKVIPQPALGQTMTEIEQRLRQEITASGPISFARFMEQALYCLKIGYYERDRRVIGFHGDFYTS